MPEASQVCETRRKSMTAAMATSTQLVLEQLEATPDILSAMMRTLRDAEARWKPAPDRFSIAEVMAHLCDVETQVFRVRLERMLNEDTPQLAIYDQEGIAAAGAYAGRDVHESLQGFRKQRADTLASVKGLPAEIGSRPGIHAELGSVTIVQLMNEWAFHDLGHIRQIAELLRAYRYYPHLGAFQQYYSVHP
jgi:hypothetical protein